MFEIRRYRAEDAGIWNRFVEKSKNATFLFHRNYMDYHADRFHDHSLVVLDKRGRTRALLPANEREGVLLSHQGLTYGGLLTDERATVTDVCSMFLSINGYLAAAGFHKVEYKAIPWIYHQLPSEEDLYALTHVCGARLLTRDISTTVFPGRRLRFAESRRSGIRKAVREGLSVWETDDVEEFWPILDDNLMRRYQTHPVHSAEEMRLLKSRFPEHIRLFVVRQGDVNVAGTLVYETAKVVHTQYISASPEGKAKGALDMLFDHLVNDVYVGSRYFDFGKSTEDGGRYLNESLIFQKEGFGGRGVCYDTYEWTVG